ncbi:nucleotidyltransferase family protein [Azospirillum sp.]|uniref:nucleotidyltransferase family protein n=1 Tax=Azospirillum sp. TaxID=34012 RepID=UPI003D754F4F
MPDTIGLPLQTMFAEVERRSLNADVEDIYPENGSFSKRERNGRQYWYYNGYDRQTGTKYVKYAGPTHDEAITRRVERFQRIKTDFRARRRMVTALKAAGLPAPDPLVGDVVEALARAGAFRLRCVLVGAAAYQSYSGLLGVLLPAPTLTTTDIDGGQFHAISLLGDDSLPPLLDILRSVEPSFTEVPDQAGGRFATRFKAQGIEVEFLVPDRAGAGHRGEQASGGAAAMLPRALDYLIHEPVRSVLLHKAGVAVRVPAPERYAVHKLIAATRRRADHRGHTKRDKDLHQAGALIDALAATRRQHDLLDAWMQAWDRGPQWQAALIHGRSMLPPEHQAALRQALETAGRETGDRLEDIGFAATAGTVPPSQEDAADGV